MDEKKVDTTNQDELNEAKEFFEVNKKEISEDLRINGKVVHIDFKDFSAHSPELAGNLIDKPEEPLQSLEIALEELEWTTNNVRVRFNSISKTQDIKIRNIPFFIILLPPRLMKLLP